MESLRTRASSVTCDQIAESAGATSKISIIIPMLNEREGLKLLFSSLNAAIKAIPVKWEIIVVDDGSTDGTRNVVAGELSDFKSWKVLFLARNFGQQAAYLAGLSAATGDAVIFLDADLQDPPEIIPQMVAHWQAGYRIVSASRASRADRGL